MSTPRSMDLPPCASVTTLTVRSGPLAVLDARPAREHRAPVVLVPGYTGSKEDFLALLEPLTEGGHRVVAYDQRGQHESRGDDREATYQLEALAADLLDLLEQLAEPAHVVGHSFGGLVARRAALTAPDALRSLTLLDSGPAALPGDRSERIRRLRPVLVDEGPQALWDVMVADARAGAEVEGAAEAAPVSAEVGAFLHRRFFASHPTGLRVMGDALLDEPDHTDALRATGLALLVAHGAADDAWPPELQTEMAARLGARHRVVDGAVHSPNVEQPGPTAALLLEFWADVEETDDGATDIAGEAATGGA